MKPVVTLLRAVSLVCAGLALTACGGPMTEEEATALESEALASQKAELGSCTNWSEWYWDGSSTTCGVRLSCGTYCDGYTCEVNPAAFKLMSSYRVCFDQNGNYTHTEYQAPRQGGFLSCGC